jgi:hypothetical protein
MSETGLTQKRGLPMRGIAALEVKLIDSDAASYAEAAKPVCSKKASCPTGAIT